MKCYQFIFLLLLTSLISCSLSIWNKNEEAITSEQSNETREEEETATDSNLSLFGETSSQSMEQLELRQAKMWSRIDELESMLIQQKERIKLLEQGLMLGIMPESSHSKKSEVRPKINDIDQALNEDIKNHDEQPDPLPKDTVVDNHEKNDFKEKLEHAKQLYNQGRYGKAYLEFSQLDKIYSPNQHREQTTYWIGRCWYKLGEFQTAKQYFEKAINKIAASDILPSAKLYLARTELKLGLKTQASAHLQELIREYPEKSYSEAAKNILNNMEQQL